MEASSQRADIGLSLPFGSSSFISCSDRSSWASSRQARLHPCDCLNRLLVRLKNVSLKNIGGDHNLNELEPPFRDASERAHLEPLLPLSAKTLTWWFWGFWSIRRGRRFYTKMRQKLRPPQFRNWYLQWNQTGPKNFHISSHQLHINLRNSIASWRALKTRLPLILIDYK